MSHNLLTLNNNSFDVNSNKTESVASRKFAFFNEPLDLQTYTYPRSATVGDAALISKVDSSNLFSTSEVEFNDYSGNTNFIESVTLKANGKYLIQARFCFVEYISTGLGYQRFGLYDGTNLISNYGWHNPNGLNYSSNFNLYTIVEITGGVSKTIEIRIDNVNSSNIASRIQALNSLYVEQLQ